MYYFPRCSQIGGTSWIKSLAPEASIVRRADGFLHPLDCEALARKTGFRKRASGKIAPREFLKALTLMARHPHSSFQTLATILAFLCRQTVSKQAVAKRVTTCAVNFVSQALYQLLCALCQAPALANRGVFASFKRVLVQDSTCCALHPRLANVFPGSTNQTGKRNAVLKIQAVYDLLNETLLHFSLSGFTRNDQRAAADILQIARPGDLLLRDLGYFVIQVLHKLIQSKVFFLSRLRGATRLYDPQTLRRFDLLAHLRKFGRFDGTLCIAAQHKLPIRLLAVAVPDAVANQRRRKAKNKADRRCHPSKDQLELLGWEILITNVPQQVWSSDTACQVYGLRWRIEIVFKAWKRHFRLTDLPAGSPEQVQIFLYARLLLITMCRVVFAPLLLRTQLPHAPEISLLRAAQFFSDFSYLIPTLSQSESDRKLLDQILLRHITYDSRSDRLNDAQVRQCLG